jgi:hypothetical protein
MKNGRAVRGLGIALIPVFALVLGAQDRPSKQDVDIHKNVKLTKVAAPADTPEEFVKEYKTFLPVFEDVVKSTTSDEPDDCALTIRVNLIVKEVGSKKIRRAIAQVAAARKNSKNEYISTLMLYSYTSEGPVSKDEVTQFFSQRVLGPAKCQKAAT